MGLLFPSQNLLDIDFTSKEDFGVSERLLCLFQLLESHYDLGTY